MEQHPAQVENSADSLAEVFTLLRGMTTFVKRPIRSAKEKAVACNSLICLLQGLIGDRATVELRNESSVTGLILDVDIYMNVSLADVTFTDRRGSQSLTTFYVRGKNIRYVHIPDHVDILKTIRKELNPVRNQQVRHKKRENRFKIISDALAKQGTSKS